MSNSSDPHHRVLDDGVRRCLAASRLYGILDLGYVTEDRALPMAKLLVESGVQILQLRAKQYSASELVPLARELAAVCRTHRVPFVLNDHPEIVAEVGADGVHVGQDDLSVAEARRLAGRWAIVGKSTHSLAQAVDAAGEGADYIGFGPLFPTPTKPDYTAIGLDDIGAVHAAVQLPVFCIGGIKSHNLPGVLRAGARRVVIVSGLLQAEDVALTVRDCLKLLDDSAPIAGAPGE